MTIPEIINSVIAGGLLGSLGQGIRIAVGLKKLNDSNASLAMQNKTQDEFSTSRLLISVFVGFVAGALALVLKGSNFIDVKGEFKSDAIITIIAIGYSGADFIEGVFNTYINKFTPASAPPKSPDQSASKTTSDPMPTTVPDEANFSNSPAKG